MDSVRIDGTDVKTSVAITLIIGGVLLVLAPSVADYLHERHVVDLLSKQTPSMEVVLQGGMSEWYSLGCWVTGAAMIVFAVLPARQRGLKPGEGQDQVDSCARGS